MEQYKMNCSPHHHAYAPASPMRHIHSSFPHYFYSTPAAPPSSDSISAFVALCESRLVADYQDVDNFASRSGSSTVDPKARPLKPPPRLQYIANIRKSLRNRIPGLRRSSRGGGGGGSRVLPKRNSNVARKDDADPFAAAAHKVTREDHAPWCKLPWWRRHRKSKLAREAKADVKAKASTAVTKSDDGMNDQAEVATSKNRKGSWIFRMLRSAIKPKGKEKEKESSGGDSKEEEEEEEEEHAGKSGQLVGLVRSTTTASRRRRVLVRRRTRGSSRRIQINLSVSK